jgi:hypothetical protein
VKLAARSSKVGSQASGNSHVPSANSSSPAQRQRQQQDQVAAERMRAGMGDFHLKWWDA